MAKKKDKAKSGLKWKKKKWFNISAPASFDNKEIGQAMAESSEQLIGRNLTVNVMTLTGNIKKQNLSVKIKINDVIDSVAKTELKSFEMQQGSIRHLVRKSTSNIQDSFCCLSKDGKKIRIKPLAVTRSKVRSGIRKKIHMNMVPLLVKIVNESNFDNLVNSIIEFNLQKEIKKSLDKVYPLKSFQIKSVGIETRQNSPIHTETEIIIPLKEEEDLEEDQILEQRKEEQLATATKGKI